MKILILSDDYLSDSDIVGGATIATQNLAQGLQKSGHRVNVITASRYINKCGKFNQNGVQVERIHSQYYEDRWREYRSIYNIGLIGQVEGLIVEAKPDVIIAHTIHLYLSYYSLRIAKRVAPVYFVAHDIMSFYPGTFTEFINQKNLEIPKKFNYKISIFTLIKKFKFRHFPWRNYLIKKLLNQTNGVITVSQELKEALTQNGIKVSNVAHNGIDISKWVIPGSEKQKFIEKHNLQGKLVVLFQGRLSGAKGGHIIVEAMKSVVANCPDAVLLVAGNIDDYANRMKVIAEKLKIGNNIVFTGWLEKEVIVIAYSVSSVVVVPSVCFDSFPNANLEAFASKKPVVATCFGGSKEIVKNGENGFVVNPFDIQSLVNSITYLLNNLDEGHSFGQSGFDLVANKFSIEKMCENYLKIIKL